MFWAPLDIWPSPLHLVFKIKFLNKDTSGMDGSRIIWNFSDMNNKISIKSVNGDMGRMKHICVFLSSVGYPRLQCNQPDLGNFESTYNTLICSWVKLICMYTHKIGESKWYPHSCGTHFHSKLPISQRPLYWFLVRLECMLSFKMPESRP